MVAPWNGGGMAMSPVAEDITGGMGLMSMGAGLQGHLGTVVSPGHGDIGRRWLTWACWKGTG